MSWRGSRAEMSSAAALDSPHPFPLLLSPNRPRSPPALPFPPQAMTRENPGEQDGDKHRPTNSPAAAGGERDPADIQQWGFSTPKFPGSPSHPGRRRVGSPGRRTGGAALARRFGKRRRKPPDCYDNALWGREGGRAALTFQRNLQRRKRSTESQLASSSASRDHLGTPPASHRIIHLLLPTAMPRIQPRRRPRCPARGCSRCPCGCRCLPEPGAAAPPRAEDAPTQRHYHSQTPKSTILGHPAPELLSGHGGAEW